MPKYEQLPIEPKQSIRLEIDREIHRLFKAACAMQGESMNARVEQLIRAWLKGDISKALDEVK